MSGCRVGPAGPGRLAAPPYVLVPSFGSRSRARSKWIPLGGAGQRPDGSAGLVRFLFEGIDPDTGRIQTAGDGSTVAGHAPLATVEDLAASTTARILPGGLTLELSGAALDALRGGTTAGVSNDLYLRTPSRQTAAQVRLDFLKIPFVF